jgi:two-component system, OmpR family, response regulator PrrA
LNTSGLRRVLVIDDDPALLTAITRGLDLIGGFDVRTAKDGASGLDQFFSTRPDCVVVDVRMPGLNGYQFVRALRGDRATAETPIVILSAMVQDREQLAGMLTGADAYLIKPVKIVDLVDAIDRAVHLSEEERTAYTRQLFGQ